jgi:hypothetical protein
MTTKERLARLTAQLGKGIYELRLREGGYLRLSTGQLLDVFIELMDMAAGQDLELAAPVPQHAHLWLPLSRVVPMGGSAKLICILQELIAPHLAQQPSPSTRRRRST